MGEETKIIRWYMKRLRKHFPLDYPVKAIRAPLPIVNTGELWGTCDAISDGFIIYVSDKLHEEASIAQTIEHEYAHLMTWSSADPKNPHDEHFGLAYSKICTQNDE